MLDARASDFVAERTTDEQRDAFLQSRYDEIITPFLSGDLGEDSGDDWRGALWTAGIINETGLVVRDALKKGFGQFDQYGESNRQALMRAAYGMFPGEFVSEVREALPHADGPRSFATGAHYLLNYDDAVDRDKIRRLMEEKFPDWKDDGRLAWLAHRLEISAREEMEARPPLVDLLAAEEILGHPVIYSFQRVDRRRPGLAMVRRADGSFARRDDGSLFQVRQLAMARTNMPGTITYGNSPQGIYTIRGTGKATNQFIGPTPYLWSKVPFEAEVAEYRHDQSANGDWTREFYEEYLPSSWRDYFPMKEAWYAGLAGRSAMIIHGTTIDPEFYRGEIYYPMTPSAGCLCTVEYWSGEDGTLAYSDQLPLVRTFLQSGGRNGYLVVVELDAEDEAVALSEILKDLLAAEKRLVD